MNVSLISRIWLIITSRGAQPLMSAGSPTARRTLLPCASSIPLRLLSRSFQATAVPLRHLLPSAFSALVSSPICLSLGPSTLHLPLFLPVFFSPLMNFFLPLILSVVVSPSSPSSFLPHLAPAPALGSWSGGELQSKGLEQMLYFLEHNCAVFSTRLSQFSGFINRFSHKLRQLLEDLPLFFSFLNVPVIC